MEITQNQIGTLKEAVDFLRAGISPDKGHRPALADAINAALVVLESFTPAQTADSGEDGLRYDLELLKKPDGSLEWVEDEPPTPPEPDGLIEKAWKTRF